VSLGKVGVVSGIGRLVYAGWWGDKKTGVAQIDTIKIRMVFDIRNELFDVDEIDVNTAVAIACNDATCSDGQKRRWLSGFGCGTKKAALELLAKHPVMFDADNSQRSSAVAEDLVRSKAALTTYLGLPR